MNKLIQDSKHLVSQIRSVVEYVVIYMRKKLKKLNIGLPVTCAVNGFIGTV